MKKRIKLKIMPHSRNGLYHIFQIKDIRFFTCKSKISNYTVSICENIKPVGIITERRYGATD